VVRFAGGRSIRIFMFVVLAGLVAILGGVLMLGVFPPHPQPHPVEKVLPNDKFAPH
jgi:hypothetical protein